MKSLYNKYQAFTDDEDVKFIDTKVYNHLGQVFAQLASMGYSITEIAGHLHSLIEYHASEKRLRYGLDKRKEERDAMKGEKDGRTD